MRSILFIFLQFFTITALAQSNPSPNMSMPIPIPGVTPGPIYAQDINASLLIVDQHNHSPGQGVMVQPNGLNINTDLSFQSNNAILLRTTRYSAQSAVLTGASEIGQLYVVGNELYYNDVTGGNQIQVTSNGSVNAGAGSITGLPSGTASASYSAGTFIWQSATNTAANMDAGSYIFRNSTASSFGLTLSPPLAMGTDFGITLPTLPASTKIISMNSSGVQSANIDVDNVTIQLTNNNITVKDGGVGTAQIADGAVTAIKLANIWNTQTFTSSTTFTVPTGVTELLVDMVGAGGGGGGGGGTVSPGGGSGGGGGAGSVPFTTARVVVAGETITITIGAAGAAGAGVLSSAGTAGGTGGTTIISAGTSAWVITVPGGGGGGAGLLPTNSGGAGGTATRAGAVYTSGGAGGDSNTNNAVAGTKSIIIITGGAAGTVTAGAGRGGPGGGGGAGLAAGGTGGHGYDGSGPTAGTAGGIGAGGGGGGAAGTGVSTGSNGGAGGKGQITLAWIGHS